MLDATVMSDSSSIALRQKLRDLRNIFPLIYEKTNKKEKIQIRYQIMELGAEMCEPLDGLVY